MGQCCANDPKGQIIIQTLSDRSRLLSKNELQVLPIDSKPIHLQRFPPLQNQTVEAVNTNMGVIVYPDQYNQDEQTQPSSQVILQFNDGTIYEGSMKNKKREGRGKQVYSDTSYYEGLFSMDIQEGYGRFIYSNGDCYQGEFRNDKANGRGTYYSHDGDVYTGQWKNDKQQGEGFEKFKDGSQYKGIYKNGKKHGMGMYKWNDGCRYQGTFKQNYFHGKGIYMWNSQKYNGEWFHSLMHGYGTLESRNGTSKYIGQFYNGVKHGYGQFEMQNGKVYKGSWQNGNWIKGVCINSDGKSEITEKLQVNS